MFCVSMSYAELIIQKESQIKGLKEQVDVLRIELQVLKEQQQADERDLHAGDIVSYDGKTGILTRYEGNVWHFKAFKKDGTPEKCEHRIHEWSGRKIEKVYQEESEV